MNQPEVHHAAVDYRALPERVTLEDTITTKETRDAPDPTMGRDPETEFMLRNAG
ncbi:heme biosynthesis protein HemY [Cellulomonas cellasea]|uniref:Uncharacterized protein n=1 Tax=Cellulomonas cellasea TaxID=43670 RepID=A0A7W4YEB7_9CELL|nr:heme biosynthesis protein HemY [Cellulomonas cellasea]MBB2925507.1 hypothetical protein [Cellulomonas cellasea]